jgi:RyR domain
MDIISAARVARETIRAYQRENGEPVSPPWSEAEEWDRDSMLAGVRAVLAGATPEELHERWMARRLEEGWKLGPVKDTAARIHPNLVPYADLPAGQRVKDVLFAAVVQAVS